jgi:hypothetical protein
MEVTRENLIINGIANMKKGYAAWLHTLFEQ